MALEKFNWQNGSLVEPAKVEVEGVSYDVVDAQFEGETPLSASNLNLMQDTLLGNVKDTLDDDTKIPSVKAVKGKILWTNSNPTSSFAGQSVSLSESLNNYDAYEIIWFTSTTNAVAKTTGIIPKNYNTELFTAYYSNAIHVRIRSISDISDSSVTFAGGKEDANNSNTINIPLYVIGHKL